VWVRHSACIREMRYAYKILVRKPEGKRPLGRPKHRWEYNINIKMELKEIGCEVWTRFVFLRIGSSGKLYGTYK
jgi:hypothetical protein